MFSTKIAYAAAAAVILAGAAPSIAAAQTAYDQPTTPAATTQGMNAAGTTVDSTTAPPAQVQALQNGDNTTVTNGPVPDTKANRAKYGQPMSHAGKRTAPAGN